MAVSEIFPRKVGRLARKRKRCGKHKQLKQMKQIVRDSDDRFEDRHSSLNTPSVPTSKLSLQHFQQHLLFPH